MSVDQSFHRQDIVWLPQGTLNERRTCFVCFEFFCSMVSFFSFWFKKRFPFLLNGYFTYGTHLLFLLPVFFFSKVLCKKNNDLQVLFQNPQKYQFFVKIMVLRTKVMVWMFENITKTQLAIVWRLKALWVFCIKNRFAKNCASH